jgi:hypothetical protein
MDTKTNKVLTRQLKIEQYEAHQKLGLNLASLVEFFHN